MRKSDALIHRTKRLKDLSESIPADIQFKVADRVLADAENILDEEHSIENLFAAIAREMRAAKEESLSF